MLATTGAAAFAGRVPRSRTQPSAPATGILIVGAQVLLKSDDPEELAREHERLGYRAAVCPDVKISDTQKLAAIRDAFGRRRIVIAEVGAWRNLVTPDEKARRENIEYVIHQMAVADAVGARCCVDVAGSFDGTTRSGPHPKNLSREFFDASVQNARTIIDAVKPTRSFFTLEMKGWNLPDGPESYLALIKAIDRPAFAAHLDVPNAINSPYRFYESGAFMRECFRTLGPWVRSCHGKDLAWIPEMNVHFQETVPGRGGLDFTAYVTEIARSGAPLILEHLTTTEEYQEGLRFVKSTAQKAGIPVA
jgi:sugar phosphate isomerase/epimerase